MKGNKKLLVVAILLLLIAVSYGTYAIYKSSFTGNAEVTAAIWDVKFKNGETVLQNNYTLTFTTADCTGNNHVKDGVIAPGATCHKTVTLDAGDSEVDVAYEVSQNGDVTASDNGDLTNANDFTVSFTPDHGSIAYDAGTKTTTFTVDLTWEGEDDTPTDTINAADTALNGKTFTVPIKLVAKQVVGS